MKNNRLLKNCKKHGLVEHGAYEYNGYFTTRCLICAREKKQKRYKDPEKRKHDTEVTRKWIKDNKIHCRRLRRKLEIDKSFEKRRNVTLFLKTYKKEILNFIIDFDSPLCFNDIKKHCYHFNVVELYVVKAFIFNNLKSKMIDAEMWKQSSLLKYHKGFRKNWEIQSEEEKEETRREYKLTAYKIVNDKLKLILENE